MQPSLYLILGLSTDANEAQIRRAYRQKARECHPDRDPDGNEKFVKATEAYHVLSDPNERARYDQALSKAEPGPAKPVPRDVTRDFATHSPSLDEIVDLFARNFQPQRQPKVTHARELNVEVILSPEEAIAGTHVSLGVPVFRPCEACRGTGNSAEGRCDVCDGAGSEQFSAQVDVIIPPRTADGARIPVSLRALGVHNLYLQVLVRVPGWH